MAGAGAITGELEADPTSEANSESVLSTGGWICFVSLNCSRGGGGIDGGAYKVGGVVSGAEGGAEGAFKAGPGTG